MTQHPFGWLYSPRQMVEYVDSKGQGPGSWLIAYHRGIFNAVWTMFPHIDRFGTELEINTQGFFDETLAFTLQLTLDTTLCKALVELPTLAVANQLKNLAKSLNITVKHDVLARLSIGSETVPPSTTRLGEIPSSNVIYGKFGRR